MPIMARARPPAAPMPASPQSNPLGGVWILTSACGALPGVATGIIDLSGRLYTLAGGWLAVLAGVVVLSIDLSGRLYTLAGGWLAVAAGVVVLAVAAAVGAPAVARDRMTAVVVVMRWVLVISTCLLWLVDRRVRSVRRGGCAGRVEKRSRPV
jgi:hypothetical protein